MYVCARVCVCVCAYAHICVFYCLVNIKFSSIFFLVARYFKPCKLSDNLHPHRYPGYVKKVMDKDSGPFIYSSLRLNQRKKPNEGIIQLYYWDYKHLDIKNIYQNSASLFLTTMWQISQAQTCLQIDFYRISKKKF